MRKVIPPRWDVSPEWESRQNGVFHFVKANRLYENGFIPLRWDLTSTQVRSNLDGMIFLHINSICQTVPPRQGCSFSLDLVCLYIYYVKKCNSSGMKSFSLTLGKVFYLILTASKKITNNVFLRIFNSFW